MNQSTNTKIELIKQLLCKADTDFLQALFLVENDFKTRKERTE